MKKKIIGITGGCGVGKSAITEAFNNLLDITVIIADKIGHDILETDQTVHQKIMDHFGESILDANGHVDRKKLGVIVFNDPASLETLNAITHPVIINEIQVQIDAFQKNPHEKILVIEAAVLIEEGLLKWVDELWVVTCTLEKRISRLQQYRNYTKERALMVIHSQGDDSYYNGFADILIDNSGEFEKTKEQIQLQVKRLMEELHEI